MTLIERFKLIKAAFDGTPPAAPAQPAAAAAPPAPPAPPAAPAGKTYKLQDGTEISISQAGDLPAAGDMVTINGAPAPANTYTLEDGSTITVDATGAITAYTPVAAAPAPPPPAAPAAPAAPPQPVTLSAEQVRDMYAKFATGTPEERLMGLEVMVKALMECNFGWKIREGNENQAIEVYKDTLGTAAAPAIPSMEDMSSMFAKADKADEQAKVIARHEETIKGLFELIEKLVDLPTAEPKTLTGGKKERFEKEKKKEEYFQGIADSLVKLKSTK